MRSWEVSVLELRAERRAVSGELWRGFEREGVAALDWAAPPVRSPGCEQPESDATTAAAESEPRTVRRVSKRWPPADSGVFKIGGSLCTCLEAILIQDAAAAIKGGLEQLGAVPASPLQSRDAGSLNPESGPTLQQPAR